ncbi:50S ribosomal protein L25/general stress protein Ctc [Leucobacter zeae]|nr:50S ribosomal protein L25/general stress protein Ctc [Leucobacter zeae]
MSEKNKLDATVRESFGKGAARKLRAIGQTPAVVYGHGSEPVHVAVETHPLSLIVRHANAIIELKIEGKKQLVLVKDVQKDPVRQIIEHVDLVIVKKGETVDVEVPVHVVGEPFSGTNALQELNTLRLSVPATSIPENVEVDVEGLKDGERVLAGGVTLPEGATLLDDAEQLVVHVVAPRGSASGEDEAAEAAE